MVYYTSIATKRPLGTQTQARLTKKNKIILHTMVGSLWGTDNYFMQGGYSGTESHFGVGYDGEILQWQDDDYRADANLEGNDDCISIETADRGTGFPNWNTSGDNVPAWTPAQIEAIALIIATVAKRHNIPIVLITNTEDSTRGIGYHRQGIDPYRTHGEEYSTAYGKVCPGNKRVAQIPQVIERARQIAAGGGSGGSEDELSAADVEALKKHIDARLGVSEEYGNLPRVLLGGGYYKLTNPADGKADDAVTTALNAIWATVYRLNNLVTDLSTTKASAPWTYKGTDEPRDAYAYLRDTNVAVKASLAQVVAVAQAVAGDEVDEDAVAQKVAEILQTTLLADVHDAVLQALETADDATAEEVATKVVDAIKERL